LPEPILIHIPPFLTGEPGSLAAAGSPSETELAGNTLQFA